MKGPSNYFKIDNSYNLMEVPFKMLMPLCCKFKKKKKKQSCKPKENVLHLQISLHPFIPHRGTLN